MRPLVIVRPEPGASATARAARSQGLAATVMPLFEVRPLAWALPRTSDFDALLLTSANALRHGGSGLRTLVHLPAYCVGEATAAGARNAGFDVARVGTGGVDCLLEHVPADCRLLHLGGADWREPQRRDHSICHIPVYESVQLPLPRNAAALEGSVVLVHSPRAAAALARHASEAGTARNSVRIAAISSNAAEAVGEGWDEVATAAEPTDSALLAIASRLCHNID